MCKEMIIVSLTSYYKRIHNIPAVLDTIFNQTLIPDLVVLNLAFQEIIPEDVQQYIVSHNIEVNRVPDTKVYKKLIPTLKKYPDACVISIDDDWLYPDFMIADFMEVHSKYPDNPISGNKQIHYEMQCHCGCASLTKSSFFGKYLDLVDAEVITNCPSDDITYTFIANKTGHPYVRTNDIYFTNMSPFQEGDGYSKFDENKGAVTKSFQYLIKRFGMLENNFVSAYLKDEKLAEVPYDIYERLKKEYDRLKESKSFKISQKLQRFYHSIKSVIRL